MKRNIFKTLLFSSALAVTVSSCELEQFPNDSISAETASAQPKVPDYYSLCVNEHLGGGFPYETKNGVIKFIKKESEIKRPSQIFYLADTSQSQETETKKASSATSLYCYSFDFPQSGYGCVAYRHSKKANMSYVDLHVSQVTVKDVPTDYSKAPWQPKW